VESISQTKHLCSQPGETWEMDTGGVCTCVNPKVEDLRVCDPEETVGNTINRIDK
jgi:hypothetical protein